MSLETLTPGDTEASKAAPSGNMGTVKGVPGRAIENVGMLDLRGVSAEEIQRIESLTNIGSILIDENQRGALSGAHIENVGSIVDIGPGFRVVIEPWVEFSRATLEAMTPGQKMYVVGIILFHQDVPPALVAEKFEDLRIVGIVLATAGVRGALMSKAEVTGVNATLPEQVMPVVHNVGQNKVSPGYLSHLADGSLYVNVGQTLIQPDVPVELLARKFAAYVNVGQTVAPEALLDLLKVRCATNLGQFALPDEPESE